MEEEIKILEDYLLGKKMQYESGYTYFKEFRAIENLLKRYKELEEENKELEKQLEEKDMQHKLELIGKEEYTKASMGEIIEHYYTANEECIPIQKIKDKIRKNEEIINISNDGDLIHELYQENKVLQELLEERNK